MKSLNRILPIIAGAIAGGVIALAVSGGANTTHTTTTTVLAPAHGSAIPTSLGSSHGLTVNQIYRAVSPGVVDIVVTSQGGGLGPLGGGAQQGEGAGVVYDTKGDILTDQHVVAGATSVKVTFQDGRTASARVLGTDPQTDVAVIHVDVPGSELHPIPLANSTAAQVGDPVVAIGSPFSLPETTTTGIISAIGRAIPAPSKFTIQGAIQTDAAINPGNSGGPLLDASAHVLGLNDQIQTSSGSSSGVGFAVPSNTVARIASGIIGGSPVKHSYVGISLDSTMSGGARIATHPDPCGDPPVIPGAPGASAGLQAGDLITAINGQTVSSTDAFITTIDKYHPGDTVTLTIKRGGQTHQSKLKLGTRPGTAQCG